MCGPGGTGPRRPRNPDGTNWAPKTAATSSRRLPYSTRVDSSPDGTEYCSRTCDTPVVVVAPRSIAHPENSVPGVIVLPDAGVSRKMAGFQIAPFCETDVGRIWTITLPVRDPTVSFLGIATETAPLPIPDAEPVTVIHGVWLATVHAQAAGASIVIRPLPPAAGYEDGEADTEVTHDGTSMAVSRPVPRGAPRRTPIVASVSAALTPTTVSELPLLLLMP